MRELWQEIRVAARGLIRNPLLTGVAVLSLALAIGANTAIFTVWNAVFLQTIPVPHPERIVNLYTRQQGGTLGPQSQDLGTSFPNYQDYAGLPVFSGLAATEPVPATVDYNDTPRQLRAEMVTGNYFEILGIHAARGRVFSAAETSTEGSGAVAVLSDLAWRRDFGGNLGVVGRTVAIDDQPFLIAGIAPPGFNGEGILGAADLWVPMSMHDALLSGTLKKFFSDRRPYTFNVIGRLRPGVTVAQAQAAVNVEAASLAAAYPDADKGRTALLVPLPESAINPNARPVLSEALGLVMLVVGLVLLIACANVANLLLARALVRRREISIRAALGAGRVRLARQVLVESLLLSLSGAAAGLLVAVWIRDYLWAHRPAGAALPPLNLSLDPSVLAFTAGIAVVAGLLFGLAPLRFALRPNLAAALTERAGDPGGGRRYFNLRGILLVSEIAFSLTALIAAGLFLASLRNAQNMDPGFDAAHIAYLRFDLGAGGLARESPAALDARERELEARVQALPGVRAASIGTGAPMGASDFARTFVIEGRPPEAYGHRPFVSVASLGPGDDFGAMGISLIEGRPFAATDSATAPKVAIVNQTMAKRYWPAQDPIGQHILFTGDTDYTEIVGVAPDIKYFSLSEAPQTFIYLPLTQYPEPSLAMTVRTAGPPAGTLGAMRAALHAWDPTVPITGDGLAQTAIADSLWGARMGAEVLGAFAVLAILLATIGIYGVTAYGVRQRTREIGIRMAVGAGRGDIMGMILRGALVWIAAGILLGTAGALLVARIVANFLYGVGPFDPTTFIAYSLLFLGLGLFASYLPARRAVRIDPVRTLREE